MVRGKRRKAVIPQEEKVVDRKLDKLGVLKRAKELGMFTKNKAYRQYEIIVPINDYEKL